jgi:hypothetical protein
MIAEKKQCEKNSACAWGHGILHEKNVCYARILNTFRQGRMEAKIPDFDKIAVTPEIAAEFSSE